MAKTIDAQLPVDIFGVQTNIPLIHQVVVAQLAAARQGTHSTKSRGEVSGGGKKPYRQKGTGRARQGSIRAPQFTGGGVVFAPGMRSFDVKVNRKARRSALRGALSHHAGNGTLALLDVSAFEVPSTREAGKLVSEWGARTPLVVVAHEEDESVVKSFRNLERVLVTVPAELEVSTLVWARAVLVTETALPLVEARAGKAAAESESEGTA